MKITKLLGAALASLLVVPLVPAVAAASPVKWRLCREVTLHWPADDARTECAMVTVPVDYAKPGGRSVDVAISRIKASGRRDGVVLINPGGPGGPGISLSRSIAESRAGGIGVHHDLIGFDPRGVGFSAAVECPYDWTQPDPSLPAKEKARFVSERDSRALQRCVAADPEFARNLTTANIARDMDRIRLALGEPKIGYYGISWGTMLGAQYRTMFDRNVDKMLLDSVMMPVLDLTRLERDDLTAQENSFHEFAAWIARNDDVYHFGGTGPEVVKALLELRSRFVGKDGLFDGWLTSPRKDWPRSARDLVGAREGAASTMGWEDRHGFSSFQQSAVFCNDSVSTRDFEQVWRNRQALIATLPVAGSHGSDDGRCAGWPFPADPTPFTAGTSPLQLVGHAFEHTTPIAWARDMRARIGGALLTVEDDEHGSLMALPCAVKAVEFFDTGTTSTGSCPGSPIPPAA
ncbi:TAP-like protein [Amycolatopsis xylanica]|uniref:TAP-like protein n=1 Tax=Amycolatopsis xylanica TaxID=589385 RepID=A0A1H3SDJ7_9PSEU|nr:alpha/beta fold hydrolase [Amycolatopsis xylanica]SDZ36072.1 TAP-like protein [Amycolatopsis xylanica]